MTIALVIAVSALCPVIAWLVWREMILSACIADLASAHNELVDMVADDMEERLAIKRAEGEGLDVSVVLCPENWEEKDN